MRCPDRRVARAQIVGALHALAPICDSFAPVGELTADARLALGGLGGITGAQLAQMRRVAGRWSALDSRLRSLLAKHARRGPVQGALWLLLLRRGCVDPSPAVRGSLARLWADEYGTSPSIELLPVARLRRLYPDSGSPEPQIPRRNGAYTQEQT